MTTIHHQSDHLFVWEAGEGQRSEGGNLPQHYAVGPETDNALGLNVRDSMKQTLTRRLI